jgi:hypothetical protein
MLSTALKQPLKPVSWINPAPASMATVLEMFFTRESEEDLHAAALAGNREVIAYAPLPNGEVFAVSMRHATWDGKDFGMPASHHETRDFIFSRYDPDNTGRPIRLTIHNMPKDGESIICWEFGGYPMPAGTWERIRPRDSSE